MMYKIKEGLKLLKKSLKLSLPFSIFLILIIFTPVFSMEHGGIYQRMSYKDLEKHLTSTIDLPYLAGIDFNLPWSLLEKEDGRFDFALFEKYTKPWVEKGKKVIIKILTLHPSGVAPSAGHATPIWLYSKGVKFIRIHGERTPDGTCEYPLFWDETYLTEYEKFISTFAKKYDGHPNIDVIGIGVAMYGGLTIIDAKVPERRRIEEFYRQNGYTNEKWMATIKKIIQIYKNNFKQTPVRITLSVPFMRKGSISKEDIQFIENISEYAAEKGVFLFHRSVSGNKNMARITNGIIAKYSNRVCTGSELVNPIYGTKEGNIKFMDSIEIAIQNAFGGIEDIPPSSISYLNFYREDMEASRSNPRWSKAIQDAHARLKKCVYY